MSKKSNNFKQFKHKGGFIMIPKIVFESEAYKDLSPIARCILFEIKNLFLPSRNGRIVLSQKQVMERTGVKSTQTITKYFKQLETNGFIERCYEGDWTIGKAREWRITFESCDGREPTDEWKQWTPEK